MAASLRNFFERYEYTNYLNRTFSTEHCYSTKCRGLFDQWRLHEYFIHHLLLALTSFGVVQPHAPQWRHYATTLWLPLVFMFLLQVVQCVRDIALTHTLQVCCSFIFLRLRLFLVLMYIFRQQHKARTLHLCAHVVIFLCKLHEKTFEYIARERAKDRSHTVQQSATTSCRLRPSGACTLALLLHSAHLRLLLCVSALVKLDAYCRAM